MNAGPLSLVDLLTSAGHRFVIPVYQRPYSWDEEQCERLWQDILAVGRRPRGATHFTGAVVWIQDGTMSAAGVTPLLVIDGQQRITTLTLLLIALAEYAREHAPAGASAGAPVARSAAAPAAAPPSAAPATPSAIALPPLVFSSEKILDDGYLVDPSHHGDDHYRLTLTQGDESTLRSLLDHLENTDAPVDRSSTRLLANLDFFRRRLAGIADTNVVWTGLRRLEVVSISLTQGHDDPQLIFETMNSTGKDLSVADLVRNEVLMGLPIDDQADLYRNQWRPIEEILSPVRNSGPAAGASRAAGAKAGSADPSAGGSGSGASGSATATADDKRFDGFLHDWLTVVNAPAPVVSRDLFREFRRYREAREDATVGALGGSVSAGAAAGTVAGGAAGGSTAGVSETSVSVVPLLREMRRFAGHYAAIAFRGTEDPRLDAALARLRMLDVSVAWPLVMTLLDWHDGQSSVGTASDPWQGSARDWLPSDPGSIAPVPAGYGPMAAGMAYDGMADEAADYESTGPGAGLGAGTGTGLGGDSAGQAASALSTPDLVSMLRTIDSYLFRRMACGVAGNGLGGFLSSLIARLDQVRRDGGNIREAFEAMLLGEAGTTRRMPDDEEFRSTLVTRDCYAFRRSLYLLATLENSRRPRNPIDFAHGVYTIEHIMPRNALAHEEWRSMLGPDCEDMFERDANRLGNLTLTAYNSELSDASFEEKRSRLIGGYDGSGLDIDRTLRAAKVWTDETITARGEELAERAVGTWPMPYLPQDVIERYRETRRAGRGGARGGDGVAGAGASSDGRSAAGRPAVGFRDLCLFGLLDSGDVLVGRSAKYPARAVVTDDYRIRLENGEEFDSPSAAAHRAIALAGGSAKANGWDFWGADGSSLAAVRSRYLRAIGGVRTADKTSTRRMFWEDFHRYCAGRPDVVDAFGDLSLRKSGTGSWTSYGIGGSGCHVDALLGLRDGYVGVDLYFSDVDRYRRLVERRGRVEMLLTPITGGAPGRVAGGTSAGAEQGAGVHWDAPDAARQSRAIVVRRDAGFDSGDWTDLYRWLADGMLLMRKAARLAR